MSVIVVIVLVLLSPVSVWAQTTLTVNLPNGTQNNDFLVLAIAATATGVTCPSPLSQLNTTTNSANEILTVCTGLSNGTPSFSVTGTGVKAILRAYRGAQTVEAFASAGAATIPALPATLVYNDTYAAFFFNDVASTVINPPSDLITVDTTTDQTTFGSLEGDKQVRAKGTVPNAETATGPSGNWLAEGITLASSTAPVTIVSIAVAPSNPSITVNSTQAFTATATLSNNTQQNITGTATWSSSNPGVATISGSTATCVSAGTSTIAALQGGVSGSTTLTCNNPTGGITFVSRAIAGGASAATVTVNGTAGPSNLNSVVPGDFLAGFAINGPCPFGLNTYQGLSTSFNSTISECWLLYATGSPTSFSMSGGLGANFELIMYDFRGAQSISANGLLASSSAVGSLTVPAMAAAIGNIGIYAWFNNQSTAISAPTPTSLTGQASNATWNAWDGYVTAAGSLVAETAADGTGNWMAGGLVLSATAPPPMIIVNPSNPSVLVGNTQAFTGTENGTDVTNSATWTSSATGVATMSGATATCVGAGSTTIMATLSGVSGNTTLTCSTGGGGNGLTVNLASTINTSSPSFGGIENIAGGSNSFPYMFLIANGLNSDLVDVVFGFALSTGRSGGQVVNKPGYTEASYRTALNAVGGVPGTTCLTNSICDPNTWNWQFEDTFGLSDIQQGPGAGYHMQWQLLYGYPNGFVGGTSCDFLGNFSSINTVCYPTDWGVFEDIIIKTIQHYLPIQGNVWPEWIQVSSEPDTGGGVTTYMPDANYATYYMHMAHAIRTLNSTVGIVGPVSTGGLQSYQGYIDAMGTAGFPAGYVTGFAYHEYNGNNLTDPNYMSYPKKYWPNVNFGVVGEWNNDASCTPSITNDQNVAFYGSRLASMWALDINSYYFTNSYGDFGDSGGQCAGWKNSTTLYPKDYNHYLMGIDLGLNAGPAQIKATTYTYLVFAQGAVNSAGHPVAVMTNFGGGLPMTATFNGIANKTWNVQLFGADHTGLTCHDGRCALANSNITVTNGQLVYNFNMVGDGTAGILLQ